MSSPVASVQRLERLLGFLEQDAGNLALRKDAVREACNLGNWEKAAELIDTGLFLHPSEPELLALAGYTQLQTQRYLEAEQTLTAAIAAGVVPARLLRARCLHHLLRPTEAMADCEAYLAASPEDADALGLLGLLLQEERRHEQARTHVDAALRVNPRQREALLAKAAIARWERNFDAAAESLAVLLEADPECGRAWHELAMTKIAHQQLDAARHDIGLAAMHMPQHVGTWHVLAWIEIMRGDAAAASQAFERALTLDRNFGETHGGLAVVAAMQGRKDEARDCIKRAL
ncbi:MAG TPA: tetratricopeptide repeat protein, partial [Steroidobacteraceae bacterium]|nr:tetratricopeptide repeat protein [Steroidobacteraceae bacterium]